MTLSTTQPSPAINETYRIVFWGEAAAGHDRRQVARAFAQRFGIKSRQQLLRLFSGRVVTLKQGVSTEEAHRYITAIRELGGICRMESECKNYFQETELRGRNRVSFLSDDAPDFDKVTLASKD